jgi:hypothetical protein
MKQDPVPRSLNGYIIAFVFQSLDDQDICIYGDPEGLRSLGEAMIAIADLDQKSLSESECPADDSFHQHYATGLKTPARARERLFRLTVGRVDGKTSGLIRDVFPPEAKGRKRR